MLQGFPGCCLVRCLLYTSGVQPFEIGKTQVFSLPYLAGFQAQARDIDAAQVMPEVEREAREGAQALMRDTIVGRCV